MTDFDTLWKFEALKLAAMEQLDLEGRIDEQALFERAKMIYNEGYKEQLNNWESIWSGPSESRLIASKGKSKAPKKKIIPELNPQVTKGMKKCPSCNEEVPEGWVKHAYKKNKEVCGHVFN